MICKSVVDLFKSQFEPATSSALVSFFFKSGLYKRDNAASALCGLLHQLLSTRPNLIGRALDTCIVDWQVKGKAIAKEFQLLWQIFTDVLKAQADLKVFWILDGVDECRTNSSEDELLPSLVDFYADENEDQITKSRLKVLLASRPDNICFEALKKIPAQRWCRFPGENYLEDTNSDAILLINDRLAQFPTNDLSSKITSTL